MSSGYLKTKKKTFKKIVSYVLDSFFIGIVFAVISSLLTTYILDSSENKRNIIQQIKNISSIYIGCNKSWADESFGTPEFIAEKNEYILCAYVSDYYVLQIAFDKSESACAYLVTAVNDDDNFKIQVDSNTFTSNVNSGKLMLGEFSYYDFPSRPMNITGYVTNGTGRYLYAEQYYFASSGAYYDYYLASVDYGSCLDEIELGFVSEEEIVDDEIDSALNSGLQVTNRKNCSPNSFGVSDVDFETFGSLLLDYTWFNSQQLRNKCVEVKR